ncbi:peptidyl-prolyl cis-trans isomerase [Iodidimonas muriae]|uniref:Peptidyl-prolyl cis-trans isomerase n=1 Tax=Iodidimonas muriae TaxID=261467 RepID=A0ABQ2LE82_9PROT|nr:peptidylprolyl isomerase [Iodidimonas muriae]GER07091.1 peptidyl-prolyl cis-trans isomerase [Kordiimonadales bacterium JCM 17843]GGO13048.1 peptidyl-prolyl cis-trans isomerase [Iodidimonas muriae]
MMKKLLAGVLAFGLAGPAVSEQSLDLKDPENTLYLDLPTGRVVIQMRPDKAPNNVERIKTLVRQGFYDGLTFHRVIPNFMAQGGDPAGNGSGGSDLPDLKAEFNDLLHLRGTMSMARSDSPDSANSQFFIMFSRMSVLDGEYTIVGRVTSGMEFVDAIAPGEPPAEPTKIVKMTLASDVDNPVN